MGRPPPAPTPSPYNISTRAFPEGPWWDTASLAKKLLSSEQADLVAHKAIKNLKKGPGKHQKSPWGPSIDCVRVRDGRPVATSDPVRRAFHGRQAAWREEHCMKQRRSNFPQ